MMMRPGQPTDGPARRPASTVSVALLLSLSLLLLAFFIVLVSLSTTEASRVEAVLDSLSRTFAEGRLAEGTTFTGQHGDVLGDLRPFEAELADLVATAVPAAEVRQSRTASETEVVMRADALFEPDGPALRRPRRLLLDQLVAALGAAPPGVALTMEFRLGTDYDSSKRGGAGGGPDRVALQRARAATLAEALLARGVPQGAFAIGLEPGLGDMARMRFRALEMATKAGDGRG